ncbi:dolichol kinase [Haloferacaceae archaeon DSL9]
MSREYRRRAVHASGVGLPLLYLLGFVTWGQLRVLLVGVTALVFVLEFLRLVVGLNHRIYDELTREYEQEHVAGYAFYMLSMTAVALVFAPVIALPGMLMLVIGDPISGMLGTNGPREHKAPYIWAIMFGVCFALAAAVILPEVGGLVGVAAAAAGALGGMTADCVKPVIRGRGVDDNLTIPPAASLGIAFVFWLAGFAVLGF